MFPTGRALALLLILCTGGCKALAEYGRAPLADAAATDGEAGTSTPDLWSDLTFDAGGPAPWPADRAAWASRRELRVGPVGEEMPRFPLLVVLEGDRALGPAADADGYGLVFTDSDGTVLPHEELSFDPRTGTLRAWVQTSLHAEGTRLYLYYRPGPGAEFVFHSLGDVWRPDYLGVWHFDEAPEAATPPGVPNTVWPNDPALVPYGGLDSRSVAAGVVGNAYRFDGVDQYVEEDLGGRLASRYQPPGELTLSLFFKIEEDLATVGSDELLSTMGDAGERSFDLSLDYQDSTGAIAALRLSGDGTSFIDVPGDRVQLQRARWYHLVGVFQPGYRAVTYLDGALLGVVETSMMRVHPSDRPLTIGAMARAPWTGRSCFGGLIDEARIATVARSAAWVSASYRSQVRPTDFVWVGPEEARP